MLSSTNQKPHFSNHPFRVIHNQTGTSLTEVMIAVVVFLIIMVGGLNYFVQPHSAIVKQKIKRRAIAAAQNRVETLLELGFTQIVTDSNEVNASISLGSINGLRSTTITFVDDSGDGLGSLDADGDTVDYKTVFVSLSWNGGGPKVVSLSTTVSKYGI